MASLPVNYRVQSVCGSSGREEGGRKHEPVGAAAIPSDDVGPGRHRRRRRRLGRPQSAEAVEERGRTKGNTASKTRPGHSAGSGAPNALDRVRQVARRDKEARFTALLHHVDADRLRAAYRAISPKAAAGVDGETWAAYGQDLESNLHDLHERLQAGRYRASPSRRAYIPKADGRPRPLGIATLEDKIAQRAVVEVLNAIYEVDFTGFSYGFVCPARGRGLM